MSNEEILLKGFKSCVRHDILELFAMSSATECLCRIQET